jgi:transcription elongation factor Elf1
LALPRAELVQVLRDYEYVFHVFPARAASWSPAAELAEGELILVVLCRSAAQSWRYTCPLTQEGPDNARSEFVPHYDLVALESVPVARARLEVVPAVAVLSEAPVPAQVDVKFAEGESGEEGYAGPMSASKAPLRDEPDITPESVPPEGLSESGDHPGRTEPKESGNSGLDDSQQNGDTPADHMRWGLRLAPRVYYDVLAHPVAQHLKQLATLRVGRLSPNLMFDQVRRSFTTLHAQTRTALLEAFTRAGGKIAEPGKVPSLTDLSRHGSSPIALALAYWAYSDDVVTTGGHSLTALARKFNFNTATKLERVLREQGWLRGSAACPLCHQIGRYRVSRFSVARHFISFSFDCPACGHEEEYARDDGWVRANSHCLCKTCTDETARIAKAHLPPVESAFTDIVESVGALTEAALADFDRVPGAESPAEAAVFRGLGLRVSAVRTRVGPPKVKTSSRSVAAFCLDKPESTGAPLVNELLDALHGDGLLHATDKKPEPLRLQPYFALEVNSEDQLPLNRPLREAANVECATSTLPSRERFKAAFGQMRPDKAYIGHLINEAFLHAQEHRSKLLGEALDIDDPELRVLLADLAKGKRPGARRVESVLRSLRKSGPFERKVYAALFWNFTAAGVGSLEDDGVLPAGRLPERESDAHAAAHPLTLVTQCPRCSGQRASFKIHEHRLAKQYAWELSCPDCPHHWRASTQWGDRSVPECRCEGCLDAVRWALGEPSVAAAIATLVADIRQVASRVVRQPVAQAVTEYSLTASGTRLVSGNHVRFEDVAQLRSQGYQWRQVEFVGDTTLLLWATRATDRSCGLARVRAMEESQCSPIPDAALKDLQFFVRAYLNSEGAAARLPLQLIPPAVDPQAGA